MNTKAILITIIAFIVGILVGVYGFGSQTGPGMMADGRHQQGQHKQVEASGNATQTPVMGQGMMGGNSGMMAGMSVESDKDFIEKMIPHHQEAVDTAREVLERGGTTSEMRSLAENIIRTQEKEIADMKEWYRQWYGKAYEPTGEYEPMMRELDGLSGSELDRVFLADMIPHHMGAVMMARSVQSVAEHQQVADLAGSIITSQRQEIMQMRSMLADGQ